MCVCLSFSAFLSLLLFFLIRARNFNQIRWMWDENTITITKLAQQFFFCFVSFTVVVSKCFNQCRTSVYFRLRSIQKKITFKIPQLALAQTDLSGGNQFTLNWTIISKCLSNNFKNCIFILTINYFVCEIVSI